MLERLEDDRALGRAWYAVASAEGALHCHYRESEKAAERAIGYFDRAGWPVAPCLQELAASLYYGPVSVPDGIRRCRSLLDGADRGGEANVLAFLSGLEAMADRFDKARSLATRARETYEELAWRVYLSTNWAMVAADIELLADDPAEAERILSESCRSLEEWGEQAHLATQAAQLGEALCEQGRYDDGLRWSEVAEVHAAADDAGAQFLWRSLRAKALARRGELEEAEMLAAEAVALAAATDALTQHGNVLLAYADVLRIGGRDADASAAMTEAIALFEKKKNAAAIRKARSLEAARV